MRDFIQASTAVYSGAFPILECYAVHVASCLQTFRGSVSVQTSTVLDCPDP